MSIKFREREAQLAKRNATKAYIEEFKQAREEWKLKEKEKLERENRQIMEFVKQQQERESEFQAAKKQLEEAKDHARAKVNHYLQSSIIISMNIVLQAVVHSYPTVCGNTP